MKTDTPRNSLQNIYFIVHNRLSYSIYRWPCLELKVKRKHSLIIPSHFMGRKKWGKKNKQASKRGQGCRNYHLHGTHIPHFLIFLRLLHFCSFTNYKNFFTSTCLEFFKYQMLELKEPSQRSMSLPTTWPAVPTLSPLCFTPQTKEKPHPRTSLHGKKSICSDSYNGSFWGCSQQYSTRGFLRNKISLQTSLETG